MKRFARLAAFFPAALAVLAALTVSAAAQEGAGFSASAVLPDNQVPGVGGYFDLRVGPGQVQDLQVQVQNKGDEQIVVAVEVFTASTTGSGNVNYTSPGPADDTLRHPFAELAEVKTPRLTVPPHSAATAVITVRVPDEPFDGMVLGSISVLKELTEEDYARAGAIVNRFSYALAVRLTESDAPVEPDFVMGEVRPELGGGVAAVICDLRNVRPLLAKGVSVTAEVLPKGGGKAVLSGDNPGANLAPNSVYAYSLRDENGRGLRPGDYLARVTMTSRGRDWVLEKEFSIAAPLAAAINQSAYNQQEPAATLPGWVMILLCLGCALLLTVLILLVTLLLRVRRQNREIREMVRTRRERLRLQSEQDGDADGDA